jgi:hypothetical protein
MDIGDIVVCVDNTVRAPGNDNITEELTIGKKYIITELGSGNISVRNNNNKNRGYFPLRFKRILNKLPNNTKTI